MLKKASGTGAIVAPARSRASHSERPVRAGRGYAESFLERLPDTKTYVRDDGRNGFRSSPFDEMPADMADLLTFFRHEVDTTGILPASGGQLGYIPGGGLYPSALGDFLADIQPLLGCRIRRPRRGPHGTERWWTGCANWSAIRNPPQATSLQAEASPRSPPWSPPGMPAGLITRQFRAHVFT